MPVPPTGRCPGLGRYAPRALARRPARDCTADARRCVWCSTSLRRLMGMRSTKCRSGSSSITGKTIRELRGDRALGSMTHQASSRSSTPGGGGASTKLASSTPTRWMASGAGWSTGAWTMKPDLPPHLDQRCGGGIPVCDRPRALRRCHGTSRALGSPNAPIDSRGERSAEACRRPGCLPSGGDRLGRSPVRMGRRAYGVGLVRMHRTKATSTARSWQRRASRSCS